MLANGSKFACNNTGVLLLLLLLERALPLCYLAVGTGRAVEAPVAPVAVTDGDRSYLYAPSRSIAPDAQSSRRLPSCTSTPVLATAGL